MDKIDFVLPWVDGQDPQWRAEKNRYEGIENDSAYSDGNDDCRYRDFGLLRYWFRAVEKFTPWVNKIYFVTCGQKPEWLDVSHPKLRLVNHCDFIPADYLPTFNSNTIELNLFRIEDLSEHFVLFNDDTFLLRPLPPEFFFRNADPVIACELAVPAWLGYNMTSRVVLNNSGILKYSMNVERQVWKHWNQFFNIRALGLPRAMKNLAAIAINRGVIFGSFGHLTHSHLKTSFARIWESKPDLMDLVSRFRFRRDDGINHWLVSGWNMLEGRFYPAHERRRGICVNLREDTVKPMCGIIVGQSYPEVCINDTPGCTDIFRLFGKVTEAFETLLPEKSSFEKTSGGVTFPQNQFERFTKDRTEV
ncbi:MAG: capsular biosynthesis protein [Lentisphaerae bacterium]|nr:capsular biosynthesis protein [Lentisphaerota bacterium]